MKRWMAVVMLAVAVAVAGCGDEERLTGYSAGAVGEFQLLAMDGSRRVPLEMVWIEPGRFLMGAPESDLDRSADELPPHRVTISTGFWLGKYEITEAQWTAVMGVPSGAVEGHYYVYPDYPATYVSWNDVQVFIRRLNAVEGADVYRLPTEAEWEYACRAGTATWWSFGNDEGLLEDYVWTKTNAWDSEERHAHAVGQKLPNPWGLYDMHGNVWEWVQDWYSESYYRDSSAVDPAGPATGDRRVARGGDFASLPFLQRSSYRARSLPTLRSQFFGVRLVREER